MRSYLSVLFFVLFTIDCSLGQDIHWSQFNDNQLFQIFINNAISYTFGNNLNNMKIYITLFVLFFSSSIFADDISDFEIEGISIGDSLLDYVS